MARRILCTTGLSVLRGKQGLNQLGVRLQSERDLGRVPSLIGSLDRARILSMSSEISMLGGLKAGDKDVVVFLSTDTDECELAARANAIIAESCLRVARATCNRVPSLVLNNAHEFRLKGIPSLIQKMEKHVDEAESEGSAAVLGISGGIKAVAPYVAVFGMLRGVRVTYVFEELGTMTELPPLPIDFDWEQIASAFREISYIDRETCAPRERVLRDLGEDTFAKLEGLFEEDHGELTLSAFGIMLLEKCKHAAETPVMLSPSARRKWETLQGTRKREIAAMLERVRNPIIRGAKRHTVHGSDLDVYKPGDASPRLAYFVRGDAVFVAEIYASHDAYERDLPGRYAAQYRDDEFMPHYAEPGSDEAQLPDSDEALLTAERECERYEAEANQFAALADERERELDAVRSRLETMDNSHLAELRLRQREIESLRHDNDELKSSLRELERHEADATQFAAMANERGRELDSIRLGVETMKKSHLAEMGLRQQEIESLRRDNAQLRSLLQEIGSWSFWRRLSWAVKHHSQPMDHS